MSQRELVIGLWLFGWFALYSEAERRNKNVKRIQRRVKAALAEATEADRGAALATYKDLIYRVDSGVTIKPAKVVAATLHHSGRVCGIDPEWARRLARSEGEGCMVHSLGVARRFLEALDGRA